MLQNDWLVEICWQSDRLALSQEFRLFGVCVVCFCFGPVESPNMKKVCRSKLECEGMRGGRKEGENWLSEH